MKQKYYSLAALDKVDATYNILLGERSNGKSYAVKTKVIKEAVLNKKKFVLLRRYDMEIKTALMEAYFKDIPATWLEDISDGQGSCITVSRGEIFLSKPSEIGSKAPIRVLSIGYCRALSMEQHYTSGAYPDVYYVVFEEFVSRDYYLPREPERLMQFVSTIARRRRIKVYMIGNTISRLCPYFKEWQLTNISKQKQGTIDVYQEETLDYDENGEKIKIPVAVEFCENSGRTSKMFFGAGAGMISTGAWQTKEVPHLPGKRYQDYSLMYTVFFVVKNFVFQGDFLLHNETGNVLWYVTPKTTKIREGSRIVSDSPINFSSTTTYGLKPLSTAEQTAFSYLVEGKIAYSDNLTGTDFNNCLDILLKRISLRGNLY